MIREEDIREFHEIFVGRTEDFELGSVHSTVDKNEEIVDEFDDAPVEKEIKSETPSSVILLITGILGLVFVATVFIGAIMYIYMKNEVEESRLNKSNPSQSLKIPGIESLVTDPIPDDSGKRIKVWCVRTAIPPEPRIGEYSHLFSESTD